MSTTRRMMLALLGVACENHTGLAADLSEPLSRNPIQGAFLEYSLQPQGTQLPMPSVVWQGVTPNPLIQEGAMVFLAKALETPIKEFKVIYDPKDQGYLTLRVALASGESREAPIRAHPAEAFWSEGDVAFLYEGTDFRVDSLTEFQPRLYKGICRIGEDSWFQACGNTTGDALRPRDSEVKAGLENAVQNAKPDPRLDEVRFIYLEMEGRRLGTWIGESSSSFDAVLLVSKVLASSSRNGCAIE